MKKMWNQVAKECCWSHDNNDPGCKKFFLPECFLAWEKAWVIIIKNFNVINSIPAQALAASFWFHIFFITSLGCNFFTARVFLVRILFLEINICSYIGTRLYSFSYYFGIKILFTVATYMKRWATWRFIDKWILEKLANV